MTEPCLEEVAYPSGLATSIPDRSHLTSEDPTANTRLAIVIVTRNRQTSLLRTLHKLTSLEADYPIVVIDNASEDNTVEVVQNCFRGVRLVALETNRGAVARNLGVALLSQPYIAFCDDDAWWAYGSLSKAIRFLEEYPCLGLIMSKVLVEPDGRVDACCQSMAESPLPNSLNLPGFPILGFIACGVIVRRAAFCSAGGFNQEFGTWGEEELLAIDMAKNGWGLAYIPSVVSHHHPSKGSPNSARKKQEVRNNLWTYWMRRTPSRVFRFTAKCIQAALKEPETFAGLLAALGGAAWVIGKRDPVPGWLERQLELKEAHRGNC